MRVAGGFNPRFRGILPILRRVATNSLTQFLQQCLRLLQIDGIKPLGEPVVDCG